MKSSRLTRKDFLKASGGALAGAGMLGMAGCGGGSNSSGTGGKGISLLWGKNTGFPQQQEQWLQQIAKQFKKQTGAKFTWDLYSNPDEEVNKMQTAAASGTGPDIFALGTSFVPSAQATGAFHVLTDKDWQMVGGKDRYFKRQLTVAGLSPSKQISVPLVMRPFAMVYNTELFKKAGISSPPKSWTEFVQDAKKMTDPSKGIYGTAIDPSDSYDPWKFFWMFNNQMGGRLVSKDLKTAQLDTPTMYKSVKFWFDWLTRYKITDPHSITWQHTDVSRAFIDGKVGMFLMISTGDIATLENSKIKDKYAPALMPSIPYGMQQMPPGGTPAETIVSGDMLAVASYADTDLAFKLIKLMTDYGNQIKYTKLTGDLPTNVKAAESLASKDQTTATFVKAEQKAEPTPLTGAWSAIEEGLLSVSSKLANQLATNSYSPSNIRPLLKQTNQQVQEKLKQQQAATGS